MPWPPFKLERYFGPYEFSAKFLLSASDCDGWSQSEILSMADGQTRNLWEGLGLGYTHTEGLPLLREEIAGLYSGIEGDDVLIAAPEEGIFLAMTSLLEKGDHVVCAFPGYQSLYQIAETIGCEVDRWEPVEGERWGFQPETLRSKIRTNTKMIVVNFPHNPTGALPSREDFLRIVEIARENDCYLFSDEMYRFLEFDADSRLPSACEAYPKALALGGMSKAFGLAGTRIGWIASKDEKARSRMIEMKDYTSICPPAPSEVLALMALRSREKVLARHRQRIARNLEALNRFLDRRRDLFSWSSPRGGTVGFARCLAPEGAKAFCEALIRDAGIFLIPSSVFDFEGEYVRFGFGRENLPKALEALDEYLETRPAPAAK